MLGCMQALYVPTVEPYPSAFLAYANKQSVQIMRSSQLDRSLSEFLDQSFQEGEPISYAGHLLSALKRFHPSLKFKLPEATQFYKNWSKSYHPVRTIPASWELTEALMGVALTSNKPNLGLLIGLQLVRLILKRPRRHLDRPLWPQSGQAFRAAFDRLVTRLGFKTRAYVPYALR